MNNKITPPIKLNIVICSSSKCIQTRWSILFDVFNFTNKILLDIKCIIFTMNLFRNMMCGNEIEVYVKYDFVVIDKKLNTETHLNCDFSDKMSFKAVNLEDIVEYNKKHIINRFIEHNLKDILFYFKLQKFVPFKEPSYLINKYQINVIFYQDKNLHDIIFVNRDEAKLAGEWPDKIKLEQIYQLYSIHGLYPEDVRLLI